MSFGIQHLGPALPGFLQDYPDITVDLSLNDERVDLVGGGFDLALRIATLEDSTLLARRLCGVRVLLVGSPAYFARRGRPAHPTDLKGHVGLGYTGGGAGLAWRFRHADEGEFSIEMNCQVWANNADVLNPALLAGAGLALQPEFLVWRELRQGLLETVMPQWTPPAIALHLVTPPSPVRPARVQALIAYLAKAFTQAAWAI
jgi:DNA-binding transcriptional LysR family regulator